MKKLKIKIIKITTCIIISIFVLISVTLSISLKMHGSDQADEMTTLIAENNGFIPKNEEYLNNEYLTEETAYQTRYFILYLDQNYQPMTYNGEHIATIDEQEAIVMANKIFEKSEDVGYIDYYRYRIVTTKIDTVYIIFLDCHNQIQSNLAVINIILLIFIISSALISLIFYICSELVLSPFIKNANKQKQFITNASHELKTPLTIISANAEVIEMTTDSNEWTQNIIKEVKTMNHLINELLSLAKAEELDDYLIIKQLNLTEIINNVLDSFNEVLYTKNITLQKNIENILCTGNKEELIKLITILIENASKYTEDNGNISISAKQTIKHIHIKIHNTVQLENKIDTEHLFDRFYRNDKSRNSKTGGHGIGLSIAHKIVENHKGKIQAIQDADGISFEIILPTNLNLATKKIIFAKK